MPLPVLSPEEARVLGCLVEKAMATPEYYPLTLNSLTLACNQKNNREPLVAYDEATVTLALDVLRTQGLAEQVFISGSRVVKYGHKLDRTLKLEPAPLAVLCELLLRGPQTAGELRTRGSRLHPFADLPAAEAALDLLLHATPEPLAVMLPVQPGRKEPRACHLLAGMPDLSALPTASDAPRVPSASVSRLESLEREVAELRSAVTELQRQLAELLGPSK
jgi:uncharacterized protein